MNKLFDIQTIILNQFKKSRFYHREVFRTINLKNKLIGIVGARGIGKTTFLLHSIIEAGADDRRALYVSADNIYFLQNSLLDLVDELYKESKVRFLCIDEIQKYPNWNQELKNIADIYKDFRIVFSGSSMIDIVHSKYDLSRRVTLYHLHGLSFREYLDLYLGIQLPKYSLEELIKNHVRIADGLGVSQVLMHFKEYLKTGYYPFFIEYEQEREKFHAVENAVQKTIYEDIANLHSLKTPTLILIEKLYKYIISSPVGELSAYKLANTLGKDFASVSEYLRLLDLSGIARFLYPKKAGKAELRNPAKMYPDNTNLIYAAYLPQTEDWSIGKIRETFLVNQCQSAGLPIYYSEVGDFKVEKYIVEVGGKNKTMTQLKGHENGIVAADGILSGSGKIIPLYLFGFLY